MCVYIKESFLVFVRVVLWTNTWHLSPAEAHLGMYYRKGNVMLFGIVFNASVGGEFRLF